MPRQTGQGRKPAPRIPANCQSPPCLTSDVSESPHQATWAGESTMRRLSLTLLLFALAPLCGLGQALLRPPVTAPLADSAPQVPTPPPAGDKRIETFTVPLPV